MEGPARGGGMADVEGQQEGEEQQIWRSQQESYAVQDWP